MKTELIGGCEVPIPDDWEVVRVQDRPVLIALEAPSERIAFRANFVLTETGTGDFYVADGDELMAAQFPMYQLIDVESCRVSHFDGMRRLAEYVTDDSVPVTMEQWMAEGYALTATVDTWRYDQYAPMFAEIADQLVLPGEPTEGQRR